MITVTLENFLENARGVIGTAKEQGIVLTEGGRPSMVLLRIEDLDDEDRAYSASPEFWAMIDEARKSPEVPWEEARKRMLED